MLTLPGIGTVAALLLLILFSALSLTCITAVAGTRFAGSESG